MRLLIASCFITALLQTGASAEKMAPPVRFWEDPVQGTSVRQEPTFGRGYPSIEIDSTISGSRFIYGHNLCWAAEDGGGAWWYFFNFNDANNRVKTTSFTEDQFSTPADWVKEYIFIGTGEDLRYTSCQIVEIGGALHPQAFYQIGAGDATVYYTYELLGIASGSWTSPVALNDPSAYPNDYPCLLPLTYPCGSPGRNAGDIHLSDSRHYWKADMAGDRLLDPQTIFGPDSPTPYWGLGYEGKSLWADPTGQHVVVCAPGYEIGDVDTSWADRLDNPLIPFVQISTDSGVNWSGEILLTGNIVSGLPGDNPGIQSLNPWGWQKAMGGAVLEDGSIHFVATISDPSHNTAPDFAESLGTVCYGIYHIIGRYEDARQGWSWNATHITNGSDLEDPANPGQNWVNHPKLAVTPDQNLVCSFSDIGYVNPADSTWFVDYFLIGGMYCGFEDEWHWGVDDGQDGLDEGGVLNVTQTDDRDENWFKIVEQTTDDNAVIYGIPVECNTDGPLLAYWVPLEDIFWSETSADPAERVVELTISDAKPNPFVDKTELSFSLSEKARVAVTIYDVAGRQVASLSDCFMNAGFNSVSWNASDAAAGIYFIQVSAADQVLSKLVVLVR